MNRRSTVQRVALVGPAVVVAAIGVAAYLAIAAQRSATEAAHSAQAVAASAYDLLSHLSEAESSARGFVVTGDSAFLAQFRAMRAGVSAPLAELRARGSSDRELVDDLDRISRLSARRLELLEGVVRARAEDGFAPARDSVILGGGARVMDTVRMTAGAIVEHADSTARLSRLRARSRAEIATLVVVAGIALVLVLGLIVSALLLRAIRLEAETARETMAQNQRLVEQAEELQAQTEQLQDQALALQREAETRAAQSRALETSEEMLRTLIEGLDAGVMFFSENGAVNAYNTSALRILGLESAEISARTLDCWDAVREDGSSYAAAELPVAVTLATGKPQARVLMGIARPDGSRAWIAVNTRRVEYGPSRASGVVASFTDITEQRAAETARERQQEFLKVLLEHLSDAIVACDADGILTYFNSATQRIHGLPAEPLPPEEWGGHYDLYGADGKTLLAKEEIPLLRALQGEVVRNAEMVVAPAGQAPHSLLASGTAIYDSSGAKIGAVVVMRDITDLNAAQRALDHSSAQLRQAQKMEAIGQLAGGVAHDFNNLLTAITSYTQFLLDDTDVGDARRGDMEEIRGAADRAAALTRQLLAFSRRQVLHVERIEPNAIICNAKRLLERLIGEDILIVMELDPTTAPIEFDPSQLEQIVFNLAVNARDAMPRGGVLTIETENVEISESEARHNEQLQPGSYVTLSVTDTGVGMDPETVARVFEPFFTTKEPGKGTGLGLSTVYGIIAQSGGSISVESEINHGTSFRILLHAAEAMEVETVEPEPTDLILRGTERILLVEDDTMVRRAVERMLGVNGYTIIVAESSKDALDMLRHESVDLMITDMIMPGLGGRELTERALALQPELKVLMMSGYTDEALNREGSPSHGISFLEKPFTARDLNTRVRLVLDAKIVAARRRALSDSASRRIRLRPRE